MAIKTILTCDQCGGERGVPPLMSFELPEWYSLHSMNSILLGGHPLPAHFCHMQCLVEWLAAHTNLWTLGRPYIEGLINVGRG